MDRSLIVDKAREYVGIPYRHLGRSRFGVDCLGLVLMVAWDLGLLSRVTDYLDYTRNPDGYLLTSMLPQYFDQLDDWQHAREGDILLQRFHISRPPQHLVIITKYDSGNWWGVHAAAPLEKVVEQRVAHHERNYAAFRIREVN